MENSHKEYGEGFVDGFNAALKSDYVKELYQAKDRDELLLEIERLKNQYNLIFNLMSAQTAYSTAYAAQISNTNHLLGGYRWV